LEALAAPQMFLPTAATISDSTSTSLPFLYGLFPLSFFTVQEDFSKYQVATSKRHNGTWKGR